MTRPLPGQRWLSEMEPELGLGIVVQVDRRTVTVQFPAGDELRTYAVASAPLRRVRFEVGDRVSDSDGASFTVEAVEEEQGRLVYCGGGRRLPESLLPDLLSAGGAAERLIAADVDPCSLFDLRAQALAQRWRSRRSPVRGFLGGRLDLIPHQFFIASEVAGRYAPRVLLADEVGLGKTIEACLIVHRLLVTGRASRVLVLTPQSLVHQWLVELLRRFHLRFSVFDEARCRAVEASQAGANPFLDEQLVLTSTAFLAGHEDRAAQAAAAGWDVVVVDEAHHLSWTQGGPGREYRTVEAIARASSGLLLLTATPEQLGEESHFARLRLLDPDRYSDFASFVAESERYREVAAAAERLIAQSPDGVERQRALADLIDRHGTGRVMFRNTRAAVGGFPKRIAHLAALEAGSGAAAIMQRLSAELRADLAAAGDWTAATARLADSPAAISRAEDSPAATAADAGAPAGISKAEDSPAVTAAAADSPAGNPPVRTLPAADSWGDMSGAARDSAALGKPDDADASGDSARVREALRRGLLGPEETEDGAPLGAASDAFAGAGRREPDADAAAQFRSDPDADAAAQLRGDPRVDWLLRLLGEDREEKFLLLCTSKAKVVALDAALRERIKLRSGLFHEDLSMIQRDRNAAWFADPAGARILLCSEIGSEGRNFQFAHHIVLFDLPPDPDLLEQRIGRLDRIGQSSDIHIHVPFVRGSGQEVLARWYHEGLDAFERSNAVGPAMLARFGDRVRTLALARAAEALRIHSTVGPAGAAIPAAAPQEPTAEAASSSNAMPAGDAAAADAGTPSYVSHADVATPARAAEADVAVPAAAEDAVSPADPSASGPQAAQGNIDALIADTRAAAAELARELERGRDRLLELSSFRREPAEAICGEIARTDADPALEDFFVHAMESLGVYADELEPRAYLLGTGGMANDEFPMLERGDTWVTFDRGKALVREDIELLTWDHWLVDALIETLLGSRRGNAAFAVWPERDRSALLLEGFFVLECVAPRRLNVDRFLAPTPIRVLTDGNGEDLGAVHSEAALAKVLEEGAVEWLGARRQVLARALPALIDHARELAETRVAAAVAAARAELHAVAGAEVERLVALARVNPHIRPEEIELARRQAAELHEHLGAARLRPDSLRLIWHGPARAGVPNPHGS